MLALFRSRFFPSDFIAGDNTFLVTFVPVLNMDLNAPPSYKKMKADNMNE